MSDYSDSGQVLEAAYEKALKMSVQQAATNVPDDVRSSLDFIAEKSDQARGLLSVVMTSLAYKVFDSSQDIRLHKTDDVFENGYSARSCDAKYTVPFLKKYDFPHTTSSGFLTRTLAVNTPFDDTWAEDIRPKGARDHFIGLLDAIESAFADSFQALIYLLGKLVEKRDSEILELAKPRNLSIEQVLAYLEAHFEGKYSTSGAARLPVLAIQAVYECLVESMERYSGKALAELGEHTSADRKSGAVADVQVLEDDEVFEGVEVKHGPPVDLEMVQTAGEKVLKRSVERYYVLSTGGVDKHDRGSIDDYVHKFRDQYGCEIIVNGAYDSLNYYLRLIEGTSDFIVEYVKLVERDKAVKYEHRQRWNQIVGGGQPTS